MALEIYQKYFATPEGVERMQLANNLLHLANVFQVPHNDDTTINGINALMMKFHELYPDP